MLVATHSGTFHADDVFSYAVLKGAVTSFDLVRTRDADLLAQADLVFDVGAVYDPDNGRFDHHMRDRPLRQDGTPYSAVGLLWREFGMLYLERNGVDEVLRSRVWEELDRSLILSIDRQDNGIGKIEPGDVASLVDAYNPAWDSDGNPDDHFQRAALWAREVLSQAVAAAYARERARGQVLESVRNSQDPRIIVLPRSMPWEDALFESGPGAATYVIYPDKSTDGWLCTAVPPEKGAFAQKVSLPDSWRGLRGSELEDACGVPGATFCHPAGFICGADSREAVMAMAKASLAAHELDLVSGSAPR